MRVVVRAIAALATFCICVGAFGVEVRVDCSELVGRIRALHGVNNGPLNYGEIIDLSAYYKELRIPLARLHDSEWPNPDVVDIHAIFPDMKADAGVAGSYLFSRTDDYVRAIVEAGTGIVYRLGESIEHTKKKYNVTPPGDYEKWAGVCVGIIRHYNEGWAGGFRYGIRYWEIWNEPENQPNMWTGTNEEFYRLYVTTARAIKKQYPSLMVGGPAIGAPGELVGEAMKPSGFLDGFLRYCKEHDAPLDFFSWHTYSDDPWIYARKGRAIRRLLDEYGFEKAEIHLNEWNYLPDNDWAAISVAGQGVKRQRWFERLGGAEGAAFAASVLIDLQDSPVDVANYYCGDTNWFGLFNRYGAPRKTFYAFKAFRMLLDTPVRVKVSGDVEGRMAVCAGVNAERTEVTVLVSNLRAVDGRMRLRIEDFGSDGRVRWEAYVVDERHELERVDSGVCDGGELELERSVEPPCVLVVRVCSVAE